MRTHALEVLSESEVGKAINGADNKKSNGYGSVPTKLFRDGRAVQ